MNVRQLGSILGVLLCSTVYAVGQQPSPSPTPQTTGRSYSAIDVSKTPPPPGPQARSPVTFTDITAQSGINFTHAASKTPSKYLLETMGGGVAIFDYNNDGRMDLFFTNGAALKEHMAKDDLPDKTQPKFWNRHQQPSAGSGSHKTLRERHQATTLHARLRQVFGQPFERAKTARRFHPWRQKRIVDL